MSAARATYVGAVLNPTPMTRMLDAQGRPYFLWDCDLTLERFREKLADPDPELRAYFIGKLLRQAKPDDVFTFVSAREIEQHSSLLARYLGRTQEFWTWVFDTWKRHGRAGL
jgi:hypothetical protein